jgi:pSer/pThr/pTyr-binding forkhead associated (FHA) protein
MSFVFRHKMLRTRSEGFVERDESVAEQTVKVGRGADCDLCLNDPRILLAHAFIEMREQGVFVRATESDGIRIDHSSVTSSQLELGNVLSIGPYELRLLEESTDVTAVIQVELVSELGDTEALLRSHTKIGVDRVGLTIRGWAWLAAIGVLCIGALLPLSTFLTPKEDSVQRTGLTMAAGIDRFWSPGHLSDGHLAFNDNCQLCHVDAFERVANTACLNCHQTVSAHADESVAPMLALNAQACTTCHTEHVGGDMPLKTFMTTDTCVSCHRDIHAVSTKTSAASITSFDEHPEFRATLPLVGEPDKISRNTRLNEPAGRVDGTGIKFPHSKHLVKAGVRVMDGTRKKLQCASCHVQDAQTGVMAAVSFKQQCQSCHVLAFSPENPERTLPHGDAVSARVMMRDHFSTLALEGFAINPDDGKSIIRLLPGEETDEEQRKNALEWATQRAEETLAGPLGKGLCASCHILNEGSSRTDWTVAAVSPPSRWFPKARFTHDPHVITPCGTCHTAATSSLGSDLLLPSVSVCKTCHTDSSTSGKVVSACGDCHDFHGFNPLGHSMAVAE